jgi:hypothetical protein
MDDLILKKLEHHFDDFYRSSGIHNYSGKDKFNEIVSYASRIIRFSLNSASEAQIRVLEDTVTEFNIITEANQLLPDSYRIDLIEFYRTSSGLYIPTSIDHRNNVNSRKRYHDNRIKALIEGQTIYPFHLEALLTNLNFLDKKGIPTSKFIREAERLKEEYLSVLAIAKSEINDLKVN